jgi:solute carrier family 24 (sodium/potassium/calcium exchanger), member 6
VTDYPGGQCQFVLDQDDCAPGGNFNFLSMYYCSFDSWVGDKGKKVLIVPVGAILMYILMYNLASTADVYLSPSLEYMTVRFGLSESLAGVTLLAFGNGAPDVFSAIAAAQSGSGSNDQETENELLSISALTGSAFFISTVVTALSIFAAKPDKRIQVTPIFFIRDIIFYIMVMMYLLGVMLVLKEINIYVAVGFLLLYLIYVILVVCQSNGPARDNDKKSEVSEL